MWAPTSKNKSSKSVWSSLGSALLIELGVVGAVMVWVVMHPPQELEQVIPLVMAMLEEPKLEKPLPPKPPEVKPPPLPAKMAPTPPKPQAPVMPEVRPAQDVPPPVVAQANAFSTPAAAAPPPPPSAPVSPPAPTMDPALAYNLKLAAAVQAAFVVPGPASALGFKGRARVEFHLRDGLASNAKIIQPSGLGAVDRAALKAVEAAAYPAPPPALAGKDGVYQIWVACF